MERLTRKTELNDYIFVDGENACPNEIANKLGKYEDIEEEIGIDLRILFKALKNGIFIKEYFITPKHLCLRTDIKPYRIDVFGRDYFIGYFDTNDLLLINYGKTWALTKEELENDK